MTDLYALGVVTFEMVTGRLPFIGTSPVDLLMKHVEARPPRPSEFVPDLPPALDAFILQMLTKDPETRPGSADALRQQLHKLRRTLRATRSNPSAPAPVEKPKPRDDVDSRRPTTPVPVPPELNAELTSQELRAAGVPSPSRRRMVPVAAAVGAAVVLVGGVAALVGRNPAQVPSSGSASTGLATGSTPGAVANGAAGTAGSAAGAVANGAAGGATGAVANGAAGTTGGANGAVANGAAGGANAAPGTVGGTAGAASASPGTVTAAAPGASDTVPGAPTTAGGTGAIANTAPDAAKAAAPASESTTSEIAARTRPRSGSRVRDVEPRESPLREPRALSAGVPRANELQRRIDDLESRISTRSLAGELQEAQVETAFTMLDKSRTKAQSANAADRQDAVRLLDLLERTYLKR